MQNFYLLLKKMAKSENFEMDRRSIWECLDKNPYVPLSVEKILSDINITAFVM